MKGCCLDSEQTQIAVAEGRRIKLAAVELLLFIWRQGYIQT
jgi:hypothetical protein